MKVQYQEDIENINSIAAVPTILDVICKITGMGFAAVARVTEERWIACNVLDNIAFGLKPGGELKIETTICHEIRQTQQPVIIDHVVEDEVYRTHHTPAFYGFQSYISMPIILSDGTFFGTLCAIDPKPAKLKNPEMIGMFKLFAELIAFHLDALTKIDASENRFKEERANSELREQFIAVLGHDLRNPLGAISSSARLLESTPLNNRGSTLVSLIKDCTKRMSELIDNVLDFARGRFGSGLTLSYDSMPVEPLLKHVIAELQTSSPNRIIKLECRLAEQVNYDHNRLAQLFSNLLGNAITYGDIDKPIHVKAISGNGEFKLSVANSGDPISPAVMERLFQPFSRGEVRPSQEGLGLGLYISAEIARAHEGTLTVTSNTQETCFTLQMPARAVEVYTAKTGS